ncbi:MAG TPA: peptidylprolyl isomerase [Micromonosporaceae bacterium]
MASTKERQQRAAARARLEREMAQRQAAARKRRQTQAAIGAGVALLLVVAGVVWLVTSLGGNEKKTTAGAGPTAAAASCQWLPDDKKANPDLKDVGTPPAGEPHSGIQTMTITTNRGVIEAKMDTAKVPCTAASFTYLAGKKFFDNTKCHRLVTEGIKVLQCGDPTGKGTGGPTYKYAEENLPKDQRPAYPEGTIAMAKTQAPSSTGSQFFIVYGDSDLPADYTVVGTVTKGMDIVKKVGADGAVDASGKAASDGKPKDEVLIKTFTVSPPAAS